MNVRNDMLTCLDIRKRIGFSAIALFALLAAATPAQELAYHPSSDQTKTFEDVFTWLQRSHYRRLEIDDTLSSRLFDRYLDYLDPSRIYFLASDVVEFGAYRYDMDDALEEGDLEPAFRIFDRFQKRRIDRTEFLIDSLANRLDSLRFDVDEKIELDRENAPWIKSTEEWDEFWRLQFKNNVLNLKLAGREMDEIREVLQRRYKNRLRRMKQLKSKDIFRFYMDVFTQSYDPHTEYFPPREAEDFDIEMSLSYEGIGALLGAEGEYIKISRLIAAGPAEKSGELEAGDRIVGVSQGVNGEMVDVVGWRVDEAVELIRGEKGTVVRLNILPANQPDSGSTRIVELMRNEVKLEEQAARRKKIEIDRGEEKFTIGVIELPAFYMDLKAASQGLTEFKSSTRDVLELVKAMKLEGVDGIVVDLRSNGGGSLREAGDLTGLFLDRGPVVQIRDSLGSTQVIRSRFAEALYGGPLAVLVNRLSASASEIFAAALQDYGRGIVLGSRTYGKGTVQNLATLGDGQLKVTLAKYYRISGGSTQHRGVVPDISFPSIIDPDLIGESSMEESLPWDKIMPVKYRAGQEVKEQLPELKRLHEKRVSADPEFTFLVDQLDYYRQVRKRTCVSLNEEERRKDREVMEARLLAIENKRRAALGLEPVESFEDMENEDRDLETYVDPLATEAANVLVDYLLKRAEG
jgi:carboxyl-terminal processing protease